MNDKPVDYDIERIREQPDFESWKTKASSTSFYGAQMDKLGKDELLAVIGFMQDEIERLTNKVSPEEEFRKKFAKYSYFAPLTYIR